MDEPTLFISYSHQDEPWKDRLLLHLGVLQRQGILSPWSDREIPGGDPWEEQILQAMDRSSIAVLLVSPRFLNSDFILTREVPRLLQLREERGLRILPVILDPVDLQSVKWLSRLQCRPKDAQPLSTFRRPQAEEQLAAIAKEIRLLLAGAKPRPDGGPPAVAPDIAAANLPSTGPLFVGRELELDLLDGAWSDPDTHLISLVAFGGVGKSALLNRWLDRLRRRGWQGAEKVFGWSFYSQSVREDQASSADPFIHAALKWFGDPDPTAGDPWEKGERLACLIRNQKTLLLLDGLEPLQLAPLAGQKAGALRDPSLATLLRELALHNPGLCVLTTRLEVENLAQHRISTAPVVELEQLSPEAGVALLKESGVQGTDEELQETSQAFAGHALALTLLGTYLSEVHNGDVRCWKEVPILKGDASKGGHARRVMESYQKWLGEGPEWSLLLLMGFFDRPAKGAEVQALLTEPIEGLTEELFELDEPDRKQALARLRRLRLLAAPSSDDPDGMDAHPLLREYLSEQLQGLPEACREGHRRLYEHLKASTKELPDTLEEMAPLFQAIGHGRCAGFLQEAHDEVFRARIHRGNEFYSARKLGAFGAELAALSNFFTRPWHEPSSAFDEGIRASLIGVAAFELRALGRLREATEPLEAALELMIVLNAWKPGAIQAGNLSELRLTLGDLPQAVEDARRSVELADRSGDAAQKMLKRTTLADALHQSGDLAQARSLFQEAERMQKEFQPQYPLLYSLPGFQYCDLLLGECESPAWHPQASPAPSRPQAIFSCRQVRDWAEKVMKRRDPLPTYSLLDRALDHLTLGRTFLLEAALEAPSSPIPAPQPQPPASSLRTDPSPSPDTTWTAPSPACAKPASKTTCPEASSPAPSCTASRAISSKPGKTSPKPPKSPPEAPCPCSKPTSTWNNPASTTPKATSTKPANPSQRQGNWSTNTAITDEMRHWS